MKDGKKVPVYKYAARENVIKEVEESLKRLGTDYIDLLQLHWPDNTTPISETMEALDILLQQGKIRAAGVSNYTLSQIEEASRTLKIASNQVPYSMLNRNIEKDLIPYALENDLGIIAYSPIERGLLSGKYFKGNTLKAEDHRNNYFGRFDLEKVRIFLEEITPLAEEKGVTLSQLVLRWTTLRPGITIVLAGARNAAQSEENAAAMQIELSQEALRRIHSALDKIQFTV